MTTVAELPPKFAERVVSAQSVFRSVMDAMARPGSVHRLVLPDSIAPIPAPVMHGTAAIAMTLFDHDTPIWLDAAMAETREVGKWLKFHTGSPVLDDASVSSFALIGDGAALPPLDHFALGSSEYPDRSTTLILQVQSLSEGPEFLLRGPGIEDEARLRATLQPLDLVERLAINQSIFPRGIDVVLVADEDVVAIPRTTHLSISEVR
jgi:alpha-D-ribose 1-methylphosphonate 5-triphosphate synthase subunit PhnH